LCVRAWVRARRAAVLLPTQPAAVLGLLMAPFPAFLPMR